jgi:Ricin-type beta-trefoil lectin domain-like
MFRFMKKFGRDSQAKGRGTGPLARVRRRNHQLNCEALESRQMLSGYYIINAASGKVLDDPGGSTSNGTFIDQSQLNGGANQRWDLVPVGNGNFFIQNEASQLVLDNALSTSNGTFIGQWQPYGGPNQQWLTVAQPNGTVAIRNAYSNLVLDNGLSTSNGTAIGQWQSYGGANQQWVLLPAGDAPAQETYFINMSSGTVFGDTEVWDLVPLADGADLIVQASSGEVLDDPDFRTGPSRINLYQLNGGLNQQWEGGALSNGIGRIQNAYSNLVLDDPSGNGELVQDIPMGLATQGWQLLAAPAGVDIHGQPSNAVVGQPISPAITVSVVDAKGNTITTNNTQLVTLSIASGPKGAQLLGTTTVRAVNGVADFTNLKLSLAGTYTLKATGGALTPDFSNVFTIAPVNVTSSVTIRRGAVHKVGRTSHSGSGGELLAQTITIKNASRKPLDSPLALWVGGLPTGVTLANATGTYQGGSYRDVLATDQPLAPGKSVTVTLDFSVSGRRDPSLSKLDEELEALLGI